MAAHNSPQLLGALLMLTALFLAACGTPEIQPLTFNAPPWQDGEVSLYTVTDVEDECAAPSATTSRVRATAGPCAAKP
ncbi:MAG: hypothetical protein H6644_03640 [Caldilineaceae bacterium]|nr:hypothetical protein [Caldilineaceae bacterium]